MKRIRVTQFIVAAAVLLVLVPVIAWLFRGPRPITFNVTVKTERIRYHSSGDAFSPAASSDASSPARRLWILDDVLIEEDATGAPKAFTGYFEPAHPVDVRIERVATGPLHVDVTSLARQAGESGSPALGVSVGRLLDQTEKPVRPLGARLVFFVPQLATRADSGSTVILPVTGQVETGTDLGMLTGGTTAILRSGHVTMLGQSILGSSIFEAGRASLDVGDHFKVMGLQAPSQGFVVVDHEPGLTAAYRSIAERGLVVRPGGGSYELSVSLFEQVVHDRAFRQLASVLAGLALLATIFNFVIDWLDFQRGASAGRTGRLAGRRFRALGRRAPAPAEPAAATPSSTDPAGGAVKGGLLLLLVAAGLAEAQTGVFVNAGEHGQGILRRRVETCFVILPHHVVEKAGGDIAITGERGLKAVGVLERTFAGDLAMLRLRSSDLQCPEWPPPMYAAILRQWGLVQKIPSGMAYLRIIEESGSESRRQVDVRSMDDESITIRPRTASDAISRTMSGASLMVGDAVLGLLLKVCPATPATDDACTPGEADVLRLDAISRLTDPFFDVPNPTVQNAIARQQQLEAQGRAAVERRNDSIVAAHRGGRPPDLPRLLRDMERLNLYATDQLIRLPCTPWCSLSTNRLDMSARDWARLATQPGETEGTYLYAVMRLSAPVVSAAPPLPATVATCTLRSPAGRVRDFGIQAEHEGIALAWGDRSRSLAAGQYWVECKVDGLEFESNRIRLRRPTPVAGQLDLENGRSAAVKAVEIGIEGTQLTRSRLPSESAIRVTLPTPKRPDAPIAIVLEIEQTGGPPMNELPAALVQQMRCSVADATSESPSTVDRLRAGTWRVAQVAAPSPSSRWRPGEYPGKCQGPGGALFDFVLEMR